MPIIHYGSKVIPNETVLAAKAGNVEAFSGLLQCFEGYVKQIARRLSRESLEAEDLVQEGFIGLFCAVKQYRISDDEAFFPFAAMCIKRRMLSAVRNANRKKNQVLSRATSLDEQAFVQDGGADPETLFVEEEGGKMALQRFRQLLSPFEYSVLVLYVEGLSYAEMAQQLQRSVKSVGNAVSRMKRKLSSVT